MSDKFRHLLATNPDGLLRAIDGEGSVEDEEGNVYTVSHEPEDALSEEDEKIYLRPKKVRSSPRNENKTSPKPYKDVK
jgi:hypothetical protein